MPGFDAVLVYDGDCPFCSAAATALRHAGGVGVVAWSDDAAQSLLDAQFGETPFALVLVDLADSRVRVGRDAARDLCERAGMPVLVQDLVGENYGAMADAVRSATGAEGDPDEFHGSFALADGARAAAEELAADADATTRHLPD